MKSTIMRTFVIAALLAGTANAAHASEGWYVRADAGSSVEGSLDGSFGAGTSYSGDLRNGWLGDAGAGYAFQNGFRLESALSYRSNRLRGDIDSERFPGDVHAWGLMANLLYDFNRHGSIQPYLGVGAGAASVRVGMHDVGHDTDTGFAYQGMAGIGFALSDRTTLDVGYRYFRSDNLNAPHAFFGERTNLDYINQAVTLGVRYQFSPPSAASSAAPPPPLQEPPPPPPPPQAAVACATSDFVVYFEWDRSSLNQAALDTIETAVSRARECNIGGLDVVGYTDTSGSAQYNMGLSERRASVVRDALVARGVSAASIQTAARGESDLARATRDGVREPLNRRTAVTISFR
jgi:outer membrane protein OmpA-like peptidoglycan-associated protein